ncbi:P-type ATPase, putative [Theileria annulata]|uniref:P-type ATPase, putative n=1 Tax=Theileria annulata TaxID=5874 RepID=Q4UIB4_THEAN|nr:P-type ATPase, putative [Theileria annulata]CAI73175.1 P-type ATPase, putative [Theileria annulata]|eukprot:XP_953853.1 P-type ATPase, putative [Theileria annulata]
MLIYKIFVLYFVTIAESSDISNNITTRKSSKSKPLKILEKNNINPLKINNKYRYGLNSTDLESFIAESEHEPDSSVWYKVYNNEKGDENKESNEPSEEKVREEDKKTPLITPDDENGKEPVNYNFDRWCKQDKLLITVSELKLIHSGFLIIVLLLTIWHLICVSTNYNKYEGYYDSRQFDPSNTNSIIQEGYSFTMPGSMIIKCILVYTFLCQLMVISLVCNELCIPMVSSVEYWDSRAKPFLFSWLVGFFTLLISFLVRNTRVGKHLFVIRVPLETCTIVKIRDLNKSSTEHDILNSMLDLVRNAITKIKLFFNIPDSIFKIPFEKYKVAKNCYVPVVTAESERFFYYHYVKYTYNNEESCFLDSSNRLNSYLMSTNLVQLMDNGGLTESESARRSEDIGPNEIPIEKLDFWTLLYREVSDPVFFMQLYLTTKSIYWRSYITAPIWGTTTLYTIYKKVKIIYDQQNDLYNLTTSSNQKYVTVLRENVTKNVMTRDLAVGDIVRVENDWEVPSDMIMLRGDAIVDESSITGESIPLKKRKLDLEKYSNYNLNMNIYDFIHTPTSGNTLSRHSSGNNIDKVMYKRDKTNTLPSPSNSINENLLKSGTKVISVLGNQETSVSAVAVVIATGVYTTKGKQIKGVLFPNQFRLKYDTQLPLVFLLTFIYALFCSYYQIRFLGWNMISIFYSIGTLSQVVPVWTSTIISISQSRACQRLSKSENIYCIAPSRIAVCGKLRVMCFDKTGTLTNNKLIFNGSKYFSEDTLMVLSPQKILENLNTNFQEDLFKILNTKEYVISLAVATCHSVWPSSTSEKFGNHVDKSMFECTGCVVDQYIDKTGKNRRYIKSSQNEKLVIEVINSFDFDYQKKLSSVVISIEVEGETRRIVFVKGAFENLSVCCNNELENLSVLSNNESSNGSYVLGLAYKVLEENSDYTDRNLMESNLQMISLLIFNNQVRPESKEVIQTLNEAMVRTVILTGDNIPASKYVARKCNMIQTQNSTIVEELDSQNNTNELVDERVCPVAIMNNNKIEWKYPFREDDEEKLFFSEEFSDISMTGDVFDYIENNWNEILARYRRFSTNESINQTKFEHFLMKIRIFARLNPNQKVRVINSFKRLGIITGMCGDGTNDCLALQASHAGISLTKGVSSMVSPFSSMTNKLESVIYLLREGRGSLVTCLACFKFMLLFGLMIAFVKVTLFRLCRGVMPEWGYLFIENAIMLLLSYTMALSRPSEKLRIRSPTSSLLGPLTLLSVGIISDNFEAPTVCFWLCYQVVNTALVFSFGGVFRESIHRNIGFSTVWLFINSFLTYLTLSKPTKLTCLFRINCTDEVSRATKIPILELLTTSASGLPFHGEHSHNVLPNNFKMAFLALNFINCVINCLIAKSFFSNSFLKRVRSSIGYKCSADRIKI